MPEHKDAPKVVSIEGEFRTCPQCGYADGFHVSFVCPETGQGAEVVLVCPSCSARFDVGWRTPPLRAGKAGT